MTKTTALIDLTGTPQHLGQLWGEINQADIREHLGLYVQLAQAQYDLDTQALIERSRPAVDMIGELAPHWLIEAHATAVAAGVDPQLYEAFAVGKYRGLLFFEECTSYAAVGQATADGRPLFHKNRDNALRPQAFYRKHTTGVGRELLPFIGTGDTSDLGVMMMVNAAGLAGSADQAGPEPAPRYRGLMNPWGLRLIAETATTCDEAVEIVRQMTERGQYAGARIATRWTFTDRSGTAMTVFNTHEQVVIEKRTEQGSLWTCEREGLAELLEGRQDQLTPADFNEASRLPGVCVEENCSSLTAVIDPEQPEIFTCAWAALGPANRTAYFPLYLGASGTPVPYLTGEIYRYSEQPLPADEVVAFEQSQEAFRAPQEALARETSNPIARASALDAISLRSVQAARTHFGPA